MLGTAFEYVKNSFVETEDVKTVETVETEESE
jgi:hypothetical protein